MTALLRTTKTDRPAAAFVAEHARVEREFGRDTQDSGNVSWIVQSGDGRLFVKTAGADVPPPPGGPTPYLDHAGRVRLLRRAIELAGSCDHPALARLLNVIESPDGPMLVYEAVPGELVGVVSRRPGVTSDDLRADPTSAYQRLAHLPAERLLPIFDTLIDVHDALAAAGWVACDLYDGCLLVDFTTASLRVVDLDTYRRGPSRNDMGRMFGSTRFMAPEEFELGAPIDQRTTVFTLGRLVWHFATRLTEQPERFCGPAPVRDVAARAVRLARDDRYPTVAAFAAAWHAARGRSAEAT